MANNKITKQETGEEGEWLPQEKFLKYLDSTLTC